MNSKQATSDHSPPRAASNSPESIGGEPTGFRLPPTETNSIGPPVGTGSPLDVVRLSNQEAEISSAGSRSGHSFLRTLSMRYRWSKAKSLRVNSTLRSKPGLINFFNQ